MEPAVAGIVKTSPGLHNEARWTLETSSEDIDAAMKKCNERYRLLARLHPLAYMADEIKEMAFKYLTDTNELAEWCYGAAMFGAVGPCPLGAVDASAEQISILGAATSNAEFTERALEATENAISGDTLLALHDAHESAMSVTIETYVTRGRERMRASSTAAAERDSDREADKYAHPKAAHANVSDAYANGYLSSMVKTVVDFVASAAGGSIGNVYKLVRPTQADLRDAHLRDFVNRYHYPHQFARIVEAQMGPIVQPMRASMAHRWSSPIYLQPVVSSVGSTADIPYRIEPLGKSNPSAVVVDVHTAAFIEDCMIMVVEVMDYAVRGHHGEVTTFLENAHSALRIPRASAGATDGVSSSSGGGEWPTFGAHVPSGDTYATVSGSAEADSHPVTPSPMPTPVHHITPRSPPLVNEKNWSVLSGTGPVVPNSCNGARLNNDPLLPVPMPFYEEEGSPVGLPTRTVIRAMIETEKLAALQGIMTCGATGWQFYELEQVPLSIRRRETTPENGGGGDSDAARLARRHYVIPPSDDGKVQRKVMEMFHTHLDGITDTAVFKRGYDLMRPVYRIMCGWVAHYIESRAYCVDRRRSNRAGASYPVPVDSEYKIIEFAKAHVSIDGPPEPGPCQDAVRMSPLGDSVRVDGVHVASTPCAYIAAILIDLLSLGTLKVDYPAQSTGEASAPAPWALPVHRTLVDAELFSLQELSNAGPVWPRGSDKPGEVAIIPAVAAVASVAASTSAPRDVTMINEIVSAIRKADAASKVFSEPVPAHALPAASTLDDLV
jgi:hypothetical protein